MLMEANNENSKMSNGQKGRRAEGKEFVFSLKNNIKRNKTIKNNNTRKPREEEKNKS